MPKPYFALQKVRFKDIHECVAFICISPSTGSIQHGAFNAKHSTALALQREAFHSIAVPNSFPDTFRNLTFAKMNQQMEIVYKEQEIDKAAIHFLELTKGYKIFTFSGELGAGKTTFINALCRQLKTTEAATSPTYSIIQEYHTTIDKIIYHMDWYRLKDMEEALNAGVEDCLESGNICLIEWPEKATELLPEQTIFSTFNLISLSARKLTVKIPG